MEGGELFNRVKSKQQIPEPIAKLYFYQMLKAVEVVSPLVVRKTYAIEVCTGLS